MSSQTETPASASAAESPEASPKKKHTRKTEAAPSATPTASAAKPSLADFFKPRTSASASPPAGAAPAKGGAGTTPNLTPVPGGGNGLVWVNTETRVYHKEGSRFYGKTKKGKYVTEQDAIKEGDRAAAKGE